MSLFHNNLYVPSYDEYIVDHHLVSSNHLLLINHEVVPQDDESVLLKWIGKFLENAVCPFCKTEFDNKVYDDNETAIALVRRCFKCGHWLCSYSPDDEQNMLDGVFTPYKARLGKLRSFETILPNGCAVELAQHIRRVPDAIHWLSPKQLELFVATIFKANDATAEVIHVGKPDDGGVDVLFIDNSKQQWLIQVKARQEGKTEGVSTIRNLLGAMYLKSSLKGVVVSTADHFSYRAFEAVGRAKELGCEIELIDKGILNRMCAPLLIIERPWLSFFHDHPQIYEWFDIHIPDPRQLKFHFMRDNAKGLEVNTKKEL